MSEEKVVAEYPVWIREIVEYQQAEIVHQYLLYDNINDLVLAHGAFGADFPYLSFREYLSRFLKEKGEYQLVLFYSQSGGFTARNEETARLLNEIEVGHTSASSAPRSVSVGSTKPSPSVSLEQVVGELTPQIRTPMPVRQAFLFIDQLLRQKKYKVAVIIEHLEKLAPRGDPTPDQSLNIEALRRWALDRDIQAQTNNLLIGLTDNYENLAQELYGADSRCRLIQVPLPSESDRSSFLELLSEQFQAQGVAITFELDGGTKPLEVLARLTKGFMLAHLDELYRRACLQGRNQITSDLVKSMKREIIKTESRDLLQEKVPVHGFEAIGGLGHIKDYLLQVKESLRRGDNALVPKGILLAGPPGTGKTMIAEALARETGHNVLRMGNIRDMWVGASERNLSKALQIIVENAPVIVFVDEIDQALGSRGISQSGDSGVGERMFARILEFMGSNEHRGRIIWVAATNRADVLDEAMVRRFDRVFPVLIPGTPQERLAIVLALAKQIEAFSFESSTEDALRQLSTIAGGVTGSGTPGAASPQYANVEQFGRDTDGLTGSDLEIIVRRAKEIASGGAVTAEHLVQTRAVFKSNHNEDMYDLQTLLAVAACNFVDTIPKPTAFPDRVRPVIERVLQEKNNAALDKAIDELQHRLGMKKRA